MTPSNITIIIRPIIIIIRPIKSNQIYFAINSVHNRPITMSSHCVWLDRQAITSHLCLPMTTTPINLKKLK